MRVWIAVLCTILWGLAQASDERLERMERRLQNLEVQVMALGIDGFSKQFTPDYVATRTYDNSLEAQKRRFRSYLGLSIAESLPRNKASQLAVCPTDNIDEAAAQGVVSELREQGFQVYWIKDTARCPNQKGYAFVYLPGASELKTSIKAVDN